MSDMIEEVKTEILRLEDEFSGLDNSTKAIFKGLIEQAAYERVYLKHLNDTAIISGLVKTHPTDPTKQKTLPVSSEITKHSASLTNILDKLAKYLPEEEDEETGLEDYE